MLLSRIQCHASLWDQRTCAYDMLVQQFAPTQSRANWCQFWANRYQSLRIHPHWFLPFPILVFTKCYQGLLGAPARSDFATNKLTLFAHSDSKSCKTGFFSCPRVQTCKSWLQGNLRRLQYQMTCNNVRICLTGSLLFLF